MKYSANWRLCFIVSLIVHFILWSVLTFVVPLLDFSSAKVSDDAIMLEDLPTGYEGPGWGNGEGEGTGEGDGSGVGVPNGSPDGSMDENTTTDGVDSENPILEDDEAEEVIDASATDDADTSPIIADDEVDAIAQFKEQVNEAKKDPTKKISTVMVVGRGTNGGGSGGNGRGGGKPQMGEPPITISYFFPPKDLIPYKGTIAVAAFIGTDGNVYKTKIMRGSGHPSYNEIAMSAARRWKFKPALDGNGEPMESRKIISIPFNKPNIERQIEEMVEVNKRKLESKRK
ncbi:MAG: TonB family protein [Dialister micraerophilus]|uniref:energy transducer TonB n=1 Tax=Dialister micraerophilus TaxID=309120 RepID=UPI00254AA8AA|nr:TonB family protein [Dialister micraerophilus]MDK8253597.1 TonB family protein [Dialister micraerophilus]